MLAENKFLRIISTAVNVYNSRIRQHPPQCYAAKVPWQRRFDPARRHIIRKWEGCSLPVPFDRHARRHCGRAQNTPPENLANPMYSLPSAMKTTAIPSS